jgi:hypothetical protein
MIRYAALLTTILLVASAAVRAQGIATTESRPLGPADSSIVLAHELVVPGSLTLTLDSVYVLQPTLDYDVDERFGLVRFTPFFLRLLADTTRSHAIVAAYRYRSIRLPAEVYRRRLVALVDSAGGTRSVAEERPGSSSSLFGGGFKQSGGIVRGFTVGSNRDLSLQSRLWLQFSGRITEDVEVLGAVTDEQTPIQPEGNTQTLREVDNIFIEFRSPYVGGTVGKFTAASNATEWTAFSRKLQGIKAVGRYGRYGMTEVVAAVSPGKFHTMQIAGRERDQGPYRLTGPSGERTILVLAGTERVFVDGLAMVRGENNDYVIDYSTGEVFFQTRRIITSASRITVDFEYTDRQYSRSFISVANTGWLFDSTMTVTANYIREADDPDGTIDITLSDDDRALLASAGGDRERAVRSGAVLVGRNDTSRGLYYRRDTTINGEMQSIYVYAPEDSRSVYSVSFSVAADGRGDYRNVAFGQYEFVGKGLGTYLPITYLPMPQIRQIFSVGTTARVSRGVQFNAQLAFSDASLNRFSLDPDARLRGLAFSGSTIGQIDSLRIGGTSLGALRFTGTARYLDAGFQPIERLGDVEFNNRWNTRSRIGESRLDDFVSEAALTWAPVRRLEISGSGGYLRRGAIFSSLRQQYGAQFFGDTSLPSIDYTLELIGTRDTLVGRQRSRWMKHRGGTSYRIGALTPGFRVEMEDREDRSGTTLTDTLYPGSFRFVELGPDLRLELPFLTALARVRYRLDDSVHYGIGDTAGFLRDGASQTYTFRGELRGVRDLSSTLDFTWRRKTYDSIAGLDPRLRLGAATILARSQTRWSGLDRAVDLDALYEVQTEQRARLQRVFVRVPFGQGQYVWIDYDGNGIPTEEEYRDAFAGEGEYVRFELPTDELFPVIDLRSSLRLKLSPRRFFASGSSADRLLAPVTTETYLRVEEKSQTARESDIYLLQLGAFQNAQTTLDGSSIVQQDVNLFEGSPEYSFRLRYLDRSGLTRLAGGFGEAVEDRRDLERSLRARWQPVVEIGLQLDLASGNALLTSTDTTSIRTFDLATRSAASDFSYRPEQSLELGWRFRVVDAQDELPVQPRAALITTNQVRAVYSLETRGRLRAELERTNVSGTNLGTNELALPYQLTEGYAIGDTWIGRLTFEYRFGANIQASVTYSGRAQPPSNRVIHTGQAELRAFF